MHVDEFLFSFNMIFVFLFFSSAELLTNLTKLTLTDLADASENIQCGFCDGYHLFSVIIFAAFSFFQSTAVVLSSIVD